MAEYFWDFGFDFNAAPKDGMNFLQNGFVLIQPLKNGQPDNVPATPVNLQVGDLINFNAFNVTDPLTGSYSVVGGQIDFQSAVSGQTNSSPFSSDFVVFDPQSTPNNNGPSVIFSGIQASAPGDPGRLAVKFPIYYGPRAVKVANKGHFLMSVLLRVKQTVGGQSSEKMFAVDPEMVVGGAG
jgi:hypothetical protein